MPQKLRPPFAPMEALSVDEVPVGPQWQYEPKWDGFRCLVFRDGDQIDLQSKSGKPLTRYFPDVVDAVKALGARRFVLDGEIVVPEGKVFSFDALLQRPGAMQHQVLLCRPGTPVHLKDKKPGSRICGASLRAAPRAGHATSVACRSAPAPRLPNKASR